MKKVKSEKQKKEKNIKYSIKNVRGGLNLS